MDEIEIRLTGTLTARDHKSHVPLELDIPAGTTSLRGELSITPVRGRTQWHDHMVGLTLWGPAGPRGTRHNNPDPRFALSAARASPGFTPGTIEPGRWTAWLDVFRLLGDEPVTYTLIVRLGDGQPEDAPERRHPTVPDPGPGWYRGDLHAHSTHSDATWDVPDLVGFGRDRGLDFVTLTDHNTVSGLAHMDRLADASILTMGGVELTTHWGHALVLGTRSWEEWRAGSREGVTMAGLARAATAAGKLFVVAHPMSEGDPECTGCRWEHADTSPGPASLVEVWNGPWSAYNEEGLRLFHGWARRAWREQGRRLLATAGTDIHGPEQAQAAQGFNHVRSTGRTEPAILDAIARGRNYLSSGPLLIATARSEAGHEVGMGEPLDGPAVGLDVFWTGATSDLRLSMVRNGERSDGGVVTGSGKHGWSLVVDEPTTLCAELRNERGDLVAMTNPIFVSTPA